MGTSSKDKRDIYYRKAKKEGYRARSAYKLIHIDEEYKILKNVVNVVDLCSAPGSWSQVLANRIKTNGKIISVDMQNIIPIENVNFIQEDITTDSCKSKILNLAQEKIDLVVFDGAPDVTGIIDLDEFHQVVLLKEALSITTKIAKKGATFVGKCFRSEDTGYIVSHFKKFFDEVALVKPRSSRNSSHECFLLCRGFFESDHDPLFLDIDCIPENNVLKVCGNGPDPDLSTFNIEESTCSSFKPIDAPYLDAIRIRQDESTRKHK